MKAFQVHLLLPKGLRQKPATLASLHKAPTVKSQTEPEPIKAVQIWYCGLSSTGRLCALPDHGQSVNRPDQTAHSVGVGCGSSLVQQLSGPHDCSHLLKHGAS